MNKNPLLFILDGSNDFLRYTGVIKALNGYNEQIVVITPQPFTSFLSVNMLPVNANGNNYPQYVLASSDKPSDYISETDALYQTVVGWNVFKADIKPNALTEFSAFRSGAISFAFAFEQINPSSKCISYEGTFGVDTPLPTTGQTVGDYYECEDVSFELESGSQTYAFSTGMLVYWNGTRWVKDRLLTLGSTTSVQLPVEPSHAVGAEFDDDETLAVEQIVAQVVINQQDIADAEQDIDDLQVDVLQAEADIVALNGRMDTAEEDIETLDERIDTIIAGTVEGVSGAEIIDARDGYILLGDRLDSLLESRTNYYYVGVEQKYNTIQSAIDQWILDEKPTSIVMISKGVYNERIYLNGQSNISFIGEDKDLVIWKTTTGYYEDAPLTIGGNVLIKNITFVANTDDNPTYEYTTYVVGTDSGASYALHIDDTTSTGRVRIENCNVISYINSAIGSGTRENQEIEIVNSYVATFTNISAVKGFGAWYCHTSATTSQTGQKIIARNSEFYSHYDICINIPSWGDNTPVEVEFYYNTLKSGTLAISNSLVLFSFGAGATQIKTVISQNSVGNNVEALNSLLSSWQKYVMTKTNGAGITVTDLNDVFSGFFMCNGSSGTSNTPTNAWYIGMAIRYSEGGNPYVIQYVWAMTDSFKKYKRTNTNGTWGSWALTSETNTDIISLIRTIVKVESTGFASYTSSANNCTICGYYYTNADTPTASNYNIHHISYNADNATQFAQSWADGRSYRRAKSGGVWGSWVEL